MRFNEFVTETAEEDRAIVSLALELTKYLQKYSKATRSVEVGKIDDIVDTPLTALSNIKIHLATPKDIANWYNDLEPDPAQHISGDRLLGMWDANSDTIYLNLKSLTDKSIRRTVAHELRHALDDIKSNYAAGTSFRYSDRPRNRSSATDRYRSTGAEINARFAEVLYAMTRYIEYAKKNEIPNPREFIMEKFHKIMDQLHIYNYFPEKEKSKQYKQLIKRAVNFIDKELAHVFGPSK